MAPSRSGRGPLLGLLLASVVSAGLLAYFATRNAHVADPDANPPPADSEADVRQTPPSPERAGARPAPQGVEGIAEQPSEKLAPEQLAAFRQPPAQVNEAVRERGIWGLVERPSCAPPSMPVEISPKGPGGVGCAIQQENGPLIRIGKWALRDDHDVVQSGSYESGMRNGTWTSYHPSGFMVSEGAYRDDHPDGIWNEWDSDGQFVARRSFKMGRLDGVTVLFRGEFEPIVETWQNGTRVGEPVQVSSPSPR